MIREVKKGFFKHPSVDIMSAVNEINILQRDITQNENRLGKIASSFRLGMNRTNQAMLGQKSILITEMIKVALQEAILFAYMAKLPTADGEIMQAFYDSPNLVTNNEISNVIELLSGGRMTSGTREENLKDQSPYGPTFKTSLYNLITNMMKWVDFQFHKVSGVDVREELFENSYQ